MTRRRIRLVVAATVALLLGVVYAAVGAHYVIA